METTALQVLVATNRPCENVYLTPPFLAPFPRSLLYPGKPHTALGHFFKLLVKAVTPSEYSF